MVMFSPLHLALLIAKPIVKPRTETSSIKQKQNRLAKNSEASKHAKQN